MLGLVDVPGRPTLSLGGGAEILEGGKAMVWMLYMKDYGGKKRI